MKKLKKLNWAFLKALPAAQTRITLPTILTLVRIILAPLIVSAMIGQEWGIAFVLFVSAACTDSLDGLLARWMGQKTVLGAMLDPIADKVLLLSCFITLAFVQSPLFSIPLWFVALVLARETLLISGIVLVLVTQGQLTIAPTRLGKTTTFVQICFIIWLFACYFFHWLPVKTYYTMLIVMVILIIGSFCQYMRMGWHQVIG